MHPIRQEDENRNGRAGHPPAGAGETSWHRQLHRQRHHLWPQPV